MQQPETKYLQELITNHTRDMGGRVVAITGTPPVPATSAPGSWQNSALRCCCSTGPAHARPLPWSN